MRWLVGLNSLRFYAIVLIVIYHLFRSAMPGGFIAVDIFFTISGFLIFSKILQEYQQSNKFHYRHFISERFRRIFPSLLICVVLTLTLAIFINKDILAGIQARTLAALTFTTNIFELITGGNYENTISPNLFEHTWFLALEMQFYLLMPLIAKAVLGVFSNKKSAIKGLGIIFLALAVFSDLLMILYGGLFGAANRSYFAIDTHMGAFCLGAAFAALNHLIPRTPRTPKLVPSIGVALSLVIITILSFKTEYSDPFTFAFVLPFVGLLSVIMIFCIIKLQNNRHSRRKAPALLRVLEYLGSLSFGIYLFHYPLNIIISELLPTGTASQFVSAIVISLSVFLAWFFAEIFHLASLLRSIHRDKIPRRVLRYGILVVFLIPSIIVLATTPTTSSISAQLASVEETIYEADPDFQPDIIGTNGAFSGFRDGVLPLIEAAQKSEAPRDITNRAAPSANAASVLVLGDSVTLGAKNAIESVIANSFVDAKESRGIETATGLLAGYAATGKLPDVIVISLATNERTITDSLLQNIVNVAGANHKFILVTAYAGPKQPRETQNSALKSFANKHDNVFVCDWWQIAHDSWQLMYADHIHLNPEGRMTYANLLNNTIRGIAR